MSRAASPLPLSSFVSGSSDGLDLDVVEGDGPDGQTQHQVITTVPSIVGK